MKVLCVGDVVAGVGCAHLQKVLPGVKRHYGVDVCIVNGENAADGNGILPCSVEALFAAGADVITGGNHSFRRREILDRMESEPMLLRPANYPDAVSGHGVCTVDLGRRQLTVVNLLGTAYMEPLDNPFDVLDRVLAAAGHPRFCVVDFHAEATAEKKALALWADGRVSAVFGTHTHVQTADEQILPSGTGFITDVGMTGPIHSILGVHPEQPIEKMRLHTPVRFVAAEGPCCMDAVLFTLDDATGRCTAAERLQIR
ncbi:MAG: TIGR00282 family metallophosphoesterase [Clostridia bacterium]|nr:TIGR00282 family metallophosphoesterase [Clostridia bacterium]